MISGELEKEAKIECFKLTVNTIGIDQRDVELAYVMGAEPREKRIAELEKENAELKEKYVKNITDCDICDTYCNSQLTKAKELLKEFIFLLHNPRTALDTKTVMDEAEQFLSEVEK